MKRQTLTILTAAFALALSSTAFATIGKAKPLTIYNNTGFTLVSTYGSSGNPVKIPKLITPGITSVSYQHLNKSETVRLDPFSVTPAKNTNIFFNLDNDGIHGWTATHFSYRWDNEPNGIKLAICNSTKFSECKFSA